MQKRGVAWALMAAIVFGATPVGAADLCLDLKFRCDGFEPNWQLLTDTVAEGGDTVVRFTDPENPDWETEPLIVDSCLLQGSPNDFELTTDAPLSLVASIVGQRCVQPNDDVTDFSVTATFIQGALTDNPGQVQGTGCCQLVE